MKTSLQRIKLKNQKLVSGRTLDIDLSYQIFGKPLYTAPFIWENQALRGNSNVADENGWWNCIVGERKTIYTNVYAVISFNIPGNGFDGDVTEDYQDFKTKDITNIHLIAVDSDQFFPAFEMPNCYEKLEQIFSITK
ncbi:hypothetical protein [Kaistella polysaccharea]|uniref:hypothetical protein n=1 Tax=Kaistella polysaccharea TaxID=2878534 RepID=UPI001CF37732|nr:hypothetical protein [Kaistella polysaccharea]